MTKLYTYVGPAQILEEARHQASGFEVRTLDELRVWLQAEGAVRGRELTLTFVIDEAGILRLADRHSEHVACAGGRPVLSAGELTFSVIGEKVRLKAASNQSTGFCPEPSSWPDVQRVLDAIGVAHAGDFTSAFDFRRCPSCGQTNLIKEGVFRCDACEAELPVTWNYAD